MMITKRNLLALVLAVVTSIVATCVNTESGTKPTQIPILEGSWIVRVHPKGFPSFTNMATFTAEGGLVNTTDTLSESVGHGAWTRTGGRQFAVTILDFLFDEKGTASGKGKVRSTVTLNVTSDKFSGPFMFEVLDKEGHSAFFRDRHGKRNSHCYRTAPVMDLRAWSD